MGRVACRVVFASIIAYANPLSPLTTITVNFAGDTASATGGTYISAGNIDLRGALNYINTNATAGNSPYLIDFALGVSNTITLQTALPPLNFPIVSSLNSANTVTIDGSNSGQQIVIDGITNSCRAFYAYQGTVTLQNMSISGAAQGGNGGDGAGGGGAGLGGALFIDAADVTIANVTLANNNVTGGSGGDVSVVPMSQYSGGGGGGGLAGSGGAGGLNGLSGAGGVGAGGGGGGGLHSGATGGTGGEGGDSGAQGTGGGGGGAFGGGGNGGAGIVGHGGGLNGGGGGGGGYGGTNATGGYGGAIDGTMAPPYNGGSGGGGGVIPNTGGVSLGGGGGGAPNNGGGFGSIPGNGGNGTGNGTAAGGCSADTGMLNAAPGGGCDGCSPTCTIPTGAATTGGTGANGGGGGGGLDRGGVGGLGGGGGGGTEDRRGGSGGYLGGGAGTGGDGGFGGGGGGGAAQLYLGSDRVGNGGFGGGGGGCGNFANPPFVVTAGGSGFGGGSGGLNGCPSDAALPGAGIVGVGGGLASPLIDTATSGGGGGAALGSAIFVNNNGGSLTIQGGTSTSGSTATASVGGGTSGAGFAGAASGAGVQEIFAISGQTINFLASAAMDTVALAASIADDSLNSIPTPGTSPGYVQGSGAGASVLIQTGSGTVVFSGTSNTYTGSTTLNTGATLKAGAANTLANQSSHVLNGSATLNLNSANQTIGSLASASSTSTVSFGNTNTLTLGGDNTSTSFAGVLSGASGGILTKDGTGTFTLSGLNTYSGQTTINDGTLAIASGGTIQNSSDVSLASATAVFDVSSVTASTTIQSLSGANTNSIVSLGSKTLIAGNSNSTSYAGQITGAGGVLTKQGTGTLTLTSTTSTYSGGTTLSQGTINIDNDAALGQSGSSIAFTGDSTLQLAASIGTSSRPISIGMGVQGTMDTVGFTLTNSGALSGSGMFQKTGSGTYSTDAASAGFSGTVQIGAGTVALTSTASMDNASCSLTGATSMFDISAVTTSVTIQDLSGADSNSTVGLGSKELIVGSSNSTSYAGKISGAGGALTKEGTGTLTLGGSCTHTGPTNINAGILSLNGTYASPITVNNSGTLKGTGSSGSSVEVKSGGTISPGNSIGTISVASLALDPSSTTVIEISPTLASSILVSGAATLDGTLQVIADPGKYSNFEYTILSASSIGGTFANKILPGSLPGLMVLVGANNVILKYGASSSINTTGLKGNALKVAKYLNGFSNSSELQSVFSSLSNLSTSQLKNAMASISPGRNSIPNYVAQNILFSINELLSDHTSIDRILKLFTEESLGSLTAQNDALELAFFKRPKKEMITDTPKVQERECSRYALWISGIGDWIHQGALDLNPAFSATSLGGLIGVDFYGLPKWLFTFCTGYSHASVHESHDAGSGSIDLYLASFLGTVTLGKGYLEMGLTGGYDWYRNERNVVFPGFDATARSSHSGGQLIPHLWGGYDIQFKWGALEPFAGVDCAFIYQGAFKEHGAGVLDMRQPSSKSAFLRSEIGLNAYEVIHVKHLDIVFRETASYVNKNPWGIGTVDAALIGFPSGLTVYEFTRNQSMFAPSAEIFIKMKDKSFVSFLYEGEFGSGYTSNEFIGELGFFF